MTEQVDKPETIGVRNQTNQRLALKFELDEKQDQEVKFAPLQKRWFSVVTKQREVFKELDRRGLVLLEHKDQPEPIRSGGDNTGLLTILLAVFLFVGFYVNENIPTLNDLFYWVGVPAAGIVLFFLVRLITFFLNRFGWTTVRRGATQSITLLFVMAIGLGLTTATVYYFGDGETLIRSGPSLTLFARILQMTFIGIAALLPALLYYLFDRQQLGTLRERFEHQIFNLDPKVETLGEIQAKYGSQLDELYGRDATTGQGRLVPGTRWPILVCTLVVTAGWIMALQPIGEGVSIQTPGELLDLFFPQLELIVVGFLGTYYFALNMIIRRYTRGDLQPKAYSHITVRIFIVIISAWMIEMLFGVSAYTRALVFIVGIVPETFITAIQEILRGNWLVVQVLPQLQEKHPLTGLEGIDLYDRSRLAEEGVTNVESLAHHDLIDLILTTRIPVSRLVDWVDQAILYLHLSEEGEVNGKRNQPSKLLQRLREFGIRNATDLEKVLEQQETKDALNQYLDVDDQKLDPVPVSTFARIEVLQKTIKDDDWLEYIRHWRLPKDVQKINITINPQGVIS
jgi:hypothetical protein